MGSEMCIRDRVHALKSELQFKEVKRVASNIGMKVNERKTQLLCIHSNNNSTVTSYMNTDAGELVSGQSLKILGFHFNVNPCATYHVTEVIKKFYAKLWTLMFFETQRNAKYRSIDSLQSYNSFSCRILLDSISSPYPQVYVRQA